MSVPPSGPYIAEPHDVSDPVLRESSVLDQLRLNDTGLAETVTIQSLDGTIEVVSTTIGSDSLVLTSAMQAALSGKLASSVTKAELNTAVSDGNVVYVGDGLNGTLGATTPNTVAATTVNASGIVTISNTTAATSTTNGSVRLAGGLSIAAGGAFIAGTVTISGFFDPTAVRSGFYLASGSGQFMVGDGTTNRLGLYETSSGSGVFEINNGTLGTLRDLSLRNVTASGQVFVPRAGASALHSMAWSGGITYIDGTGGIAYRDSGSGYPTTFAVSNAGNVTASGTVRLGTYTVGTLPSAASNTRALAFVTDSNLAFNSTNLGATVTAGGSTLVPVFSNGTNWVIG